MAVEEPRRSTRLRKPVKTYAEEQAEELDGVKIAKKQHVKNSSHGQDEDFEVTQDVKEEISDEPSDGPYQTSEVESPKPTKKRSMMLDSAQFYGHEAEGNLIPWGDSRQRKQPRIYPLPGHYGASSQKLGNDGIKPTKKRSKVVPDSAQLYGHEAEGTLIPWGVSRQRKQPRIYPLPNRRGTSSQKLYDDGMWLENAALRKIEKAKAQISKLKLGQLGARLKPFVEHPPPWYHVFLERASTQKIFVLERHCATDEDCHAHHQDCPYEALQIAGSKGNVYTITISHITTCTCPVGVFNAKGQEKQCKHVLYVLHHVLKAPDNLKYQAAFLLSELKELFANAPPLPAEVVEEGSQDNNRKPIEGDCPICFMELENDEDIVWCQAACGNNVHKACFDKWAKVKAQVTCPFCRTLWQLPSKAQSGKIHAVNATENGAGGYLNVHDQLDYEMSGAV